MELKSTAEVVNEIDFKKEVVISRIFADPLVIKQQRARYSNIVTGGQKLSPEVIDTEIQFGMFKDNIFSAIMNQIVKCFKFNIDEEEKKQIAQRLEKDFAEAGEKSSSENKLRIMMIAEQIIKKHLVFDYLEKLWNVVISDEEVKRMLDVFYERTNQSVHEILSDKERFENIRMTILEEKMVLKIINAFPIRFNLSEPGVSDPNTNSRASGEKAKSEQEMSSEKDKKKS